MIKYRPDIDGLRAFAVLSVVIFHAFPNSLAGGFVGVDVFFVISGYLISSIIIRDIKKNNFSFLHFYKKRILRIFPALIAVLAFCFYIGWKTLLPDEFSALGKHIAGGAGFVSNMVLWSESGYFDVSSSLKPLLHLWSLGVEEQFYFIWPIILIISFKAGKGFLKCSVAVLSLSLVYSIYTMHTDATTNYYSPLSRFWELMFGVVLAVLTTENKNLIKSVMKHSNAISIIGLIMLVASLLFINEKMAFPGYIALLPVTGATLIILSGSDAFVNKHILSLRPVVFFGTISYPLYLWHWPLMSFLRIWLGKQPSNLAMLSCVILSIILAFLTYVLIEKPIRFGVVRKFSAIPLASIIAAFFVVGVTTNYYNGFNDRYIRSINNPSDDGRDIADGGFLQSGCGSVDKTVDFANCQNDKRGIAINAIIGDSKAAALLPGLVRTSSESSRWLAIAGETGHGSPAPVITDNIRYKPYQKYIVPAVESIVKNDNIKNVAIVTATRVLFMLSETNSLEGINSSDFYDVAFNGLSDVVTKLVKANKKVILVVDNPTLPAPQDCIIRTTSSELVNFIIKQSGATICSIKESDQLSNAERYFKLLNQVKDTQPRGSVSIFNSYPYLCDTKTSECSMFMNGRRMYGYTDHISDYASGLVGKGLNDFINSPQ
ncbi:acyltransferase [Enterobacteriaceae bacterium 89]|nr:acyltransferase [Enterobacteriaceae bacterium 89]